MSRINIEAQVPRCPNFILTKDGGCYPLGAFTDADLRRLGKEFTAAMLERAREQRAAKASNAQAQGAPASGDHLPRLDGCGQSTGETK